MSDFINFNCFFHFCDMVLFDNNKTFLHAVQHDDCDSDNVDEYRLYSCKFDACKIYEYVQYCDVELEHNGVCWSGSMGKDIFGDCSILSFCELDEVDPNILCQMLKHFLSDNDNNDRSNSLYVVRCDNKNNMPVFSLFVVLRVFSVFRNNYNDVESYFLYRDYVKKNNTNMSGLFLRLPLVYYKYYFRSSLDNNSLSDIMLLPQQKPSVGKYVLCDFNICNVLYRNSSIYCVYSQLYPVYYVVFLSCSICTIGVYVWIKSFLYL